MYQITGSEVRYETIATAVQDKIDTQPDFEQRLLELSHIVGKLVEWGKLDLHQLADVGIEPVPAPKTYRPKANSASSQYRNENALRREKIMQWERSGQHIGSKEYARLVNDEQIWMLENNIGWTSELHWHYLEPK